MPINRFSFLDDHRCNFFAGFFEGEAYFGINKRNTPTGMSYTPVVEITQSGHEAIKILKRWHVELGCGTYDLSHEKSWYASRSESRHEKSARIRWSGAAARELCETLVNYLEIKQPQARLLVDWPLRKSGRVSEEERRQNQIIFKEQERIYVRIKKLNAEK